MLRKFLFFLFVSPAVLSADLIESKNSFIQLVKQEKSGFLKEKIEKELQLPKPDFRSKLGVAFVYAAKNNDPKSMGIILSFVDHGTIDMWINYLLCCCCKEPELFYESTLQDAFVAATKNNAQDALEFLQELDGYLCVKPEYESYASWKIFKLSFKKQE